MAGIEERPRDLVYELGLLEKMSNVRVNGTPLKNVPFGDGYSIWHRFVLFVFSSDIKRFSVARNFEAYLNGEGGRDASLSLKGFFVGMFGVLISCVAWAAVSVMKPRVILFGIDRVSDSEFKSDFRTRSLHAYLRKKHISYAECLHTVFNVSFLGNVFIRLRPVFYLEALDTWYAVLKRIGMAKKSVAPELSGLDAFTVEERKFASYVIKKYLGEVGLVEFRVDMLTAFIRASGARAVWMIDDARHYHDVALAAKIAGIPSYAFQHGHFTRYHVGWLKNGSVLSYVRPDFLVLWSEYWEKELMRLGSVFPDSALIVGGFPERASVLPLKKAGHPLILIPHETDSPKTEVAAFIKQILTDVPSARIVMKLRPDYPREGQMRAYPTENAGGRISAVTNLSELTESPSAVLGVYSSFLYDMVSVGVPVGLMETSMDYGKGLVENGLADSVSLDGISSWISASGAMSDSELEKRKKSLMSDVSFETTLDTVAASCGIAPVKTVG